MAKLTLYHGSRNGIDGPIRMTDRNRSACDFGRGFYMGDSPTQPKTLICDERREGLGFDEVLAELLKEGDA